MAEIILKIRDGSGYEDGDVLCAFNRRSIRCVHAEHICHPWKATVNKDGWRPLDSPAEHMHRTCYQFKFERVSQTEVLKTDLLTGETWIIGPTPNEQREHIMVDEFIRRRRKGKAPDGGPKKAIFGTDGHEVWYGGRMDTSDAKLDLVWVKIAEKAGRLESEEEFQLWPMGRLDIRHHLVVRVTEFSDQEAEAFVRPQYDWLDYENDVKKEDENGVPVVLAKRHIKIDWRTKLLDDLKVTKADVLDHDKPVGRDVVFPVDRLGHRSKEQPEQSQRDKLHDKELGGPVR